MQKSLNAIKPAYRFHDFNSEGLAILVLGGFVFLKDRKLYFFFNVLLTSLVFTLYLYMLAMCIITITIKSDEKMITAQALQTLCMLLAVIIMPFIKRITRNSLNDAVRMIRGGIYVYEEVPDEEHLKIISSRVDQIRYLYSLITKLCFFSAISNLLFIPLVNLIIGKGDDSEDALNPYLPLPIYMPFNTRSSIGYVVAFTSTAIYLSISSTTIISFVTTYLSCTLQLIAQLEVLNHSLRNIERRAHLNLFKNIATVKCISVEDLQNNIEFRRRLYMCLRQNILHHQTILRFKATISPYTENMNFMCMLLFSLFLAASIMAFIENSGFNIAVLLPLVMVLFCYLQVCGLGQFITEKSAEITHSLYSTPWHSCDKPFCLLLKIMMTNTQKPIILKASGFNRDVSLKTYGDMISAGYKIINVLR